MVGVLLLDCSSPSEWYVLSPTSVPSLRRGVGSVPSTGVSTTRDSVQAGDPESDTVLVLNAPGRTGPPVLRRVGRHDHSGSVQSRPGFWSRSS